MWSKAMGPPPKKIRANASVARASGSSYPPLPINPLCMWTLRMAIYTDGKGGNASEQAQQDEQASKEFGEGGEVGGPGGEPEAGDKLSMVVKSAENLVVSVVEHDGAQGEAHDKECEGLQAVEVAQVVPPAERKHRLQQRGGGRKGRGRVGAGYRN